MFTTYRSISPSVSSIYQINSHSYDSIKTANMSATRHQMWIHVKTTILEIADNSPLDRSFTLGGIATLSDLLSHTEGQINSMTYVEASMNNVTDLPLGNKAKIHALIAYQSHWCHQNENPEITWTEHMQDDFENFCICIYDPNELVRIYSSHGT